MSAENSDVDERSYARLTISFCSGYTLNTKYKTRSDLESLENFRGIVGIYHRNLLEKWKFRVMCVRLQALSAAKATS